MYAAFLRSRGVPLKKFKKGPKNGRSARLDYVKLAVVAKTGSINY
jgi:hypothetical protein